MSSLGILALSFVVEEALQHTYNLIYTTTLSGKTFHLFWVKVLLSQGRPALHCSKTVWQISRENEWFDDYFFEYLLFIFQWVPFLVIFYIPLS